MASLSRRFRHALRLRDRNTRRLTNQAIGYYALLYVPGTSHLTEVELPVDDVLLDVENQVWYFQKGKPWGTTFKIGAEIRTPKNGEAWGPAFIGKRGNLKHTFVRTQFEADLMGAPAQVRTRRS